MMSPDNSKLPAGKDETQSSGGRKNSSTKPPNEASLKCPRCDSSNTKFCYYNNYNLTQPRHFCKTCRRYWTKGGALRNVPIGGGCRKNKKMKSSQMNSTGTGESSDIGGLKFFQGISPAMDFQLGGLRPNNNSTLFNHQFSSFGDLSNTCANPSNPYFNFDPSANSSPPLMGFPSFQELGSNLNVHNSSTLASSIESLSSINQDLHWKLQQQRLSTMLFAGDENINLQKDENNGIMEPTVQKPQPILFQNLDVSNQESCGIGRKEGTGNENQLSTEWFFDTSYATASDNTTPATGNNMSYGHENNTNNWGTGMQAWSSDLSTNQYNVLP